MELDRQQLATLAAVVEHGSFDAAARVLHVTPSAVSQRVKALEQRAGQVLVRRVRPCLPTAPGEVLVRLAGQLALLEAEAGRALTPDARGVVRLAVAVNADSLSTWFPRVLRELPDDVVVDLRREDQDHSDELLRAGTVMAAVTADGRAVQGCRVHALGAMRYLALAAPAFHRRWIADADAGDGPGAPAQGRVGRADAARRVGRAPAIAFNDKDALQDRFVQQLGGGALEAPVHHVPSSWAYVELVRQGLGWGMVPEVAAREDLASGALVEVVPGGHLDVPLHWQHWRLETPLLADLTRRVLEVAGKDLHPLF
ncbi:LysR family transcriptional regulator ArgP [Actinotalea subterranea]|uniref:LysR family transcriptional regulator ArgP n=1 Tax=Actinotalea subterranea TaxID=2607497 RepID=UPI0011EE1286|nr:LysR family transcriptional regulator ArgP [Actinotalea subterranea]